jgi:hypothetical protein
MAGYVGLSNPVSVVDTIQTYGIADNAITTDKIADGSITSIKLALTEDWGLITGSLDATTEDFGSVA